MKDEEIQQIPILPTTSIQQMKEKKNVNEKR